MAQAIGSNIDISALSQAIKNADKGLEDLQKTSDKVTKSINKAFESVAHGGIQQLSQNIEALNKGLQNLGKSSGSKGVTRAMEEISKSADNAIDKVNRMGSLMQNITGEKRSNIKTGAISKINDEIEVSMKRLGELKNLLDFYTRGEGQKAVNANVVDTTNIQNESKALMQKIELLNREKEHLQAVASLKERLAQQQKQRDDQWMQMEEDQKKRKRERELQAEKEHAIRLAQERKQAQEKYNSLFGENSSNPKAAIANANASIGRGGEFKSINDLQSAIRQLENAQRKVNTSTKQGREEFKRLDAKLVETRAEMARLTGQTTGLQGALGAVGRAIVAAFSFHAIRGFVSNVVNVRKEMELQHKALQAIIGNKEQANRIWDQTMQLAVKSPFTIQELTSYTRQLAAYRIETSKLYETNKMLADVSAGLGVDMSRLILAFGQVKSASFLRGTELRQFTEAGIPMLEELAKHFTELRGRVVTVDQAFEMISKRQVSFKDVEQVFKNMTSEGGVFFNMQEEMSNTLHGKISNLKDSITLMLNEIGMSNEGIIHDALDMVKALVENWRYVAAAIKTVLVTYLAYQATSTIVAVMTGRLTYTMDKLAVGEVAAAKTTNSLTFALARLGNAMRGVSAQQMGGVGGLTGTLGKLGKYLGPLGMITTAVIGGVTAFNAFNEASEETSYEEKRRQDEMKQNLEQLNGKGETLAKTINKIRDAFKNAVDSDNIIDQRIQLQKLIDIASEEYKMVIKVEVDKMSAKEAADTMNKIHTDLIKTNTFATSYASTMERQMPDFAKNVENYTSNISDIYARMDDILNILNRDAGREIATYKWDDTQSNMDNLYELWNVLDKAYKSQFVNVAPIVDEEEWEKREALKDYILAYKDMVAKAWVALNDIQIEAENAAKGFGYTTAKKAGLLVQSLKKGIATYLSQKGVEDREIEQLLRDSIGGLFKVDLGEVTSFEIKPWQERWNKYLDSIKATTKKTLMKEFGDNTRMWNTMGFDESGFFPSLPAMFTEANADQTEEQHKAYIEAEIKRYKELKEAYEKGIREAGVVDESLYQESLIALPALEKALLFHGSGSEDKSAKKKIQDRIKLLEEMHKKYLELKKAYGDEKAEREVRSAFSDTFAEVFEGTGINLGAYKTFGGLVGEAGDAGAEAGTALTEEMQAKINEFASKGVYIRGLDDAGKEAALDFIKGFEGWENKAYKDIGSKKWAIGIGNNYDPETGAAITKDTVWSDEDIIRKNKIAMETHMNALNKILEVHKDIVITEEQYMALLDLTWQTGGAAALGYSKDRDSFKRWLEEIDGMPIVKVLTDGTRQKTGIFDIDVDQIMADYDKATTAVEKVAIAMQYVGIRNSQDKDTTKFMIERGKERAELFAGEIDLATQLNNALEDMGGIDFMSKDDMVKSLNRLKELAKAAGPEVEKLLSKTISGYEAEIGLKVVEDADKELREDVQELFDRHSLTIELKKLQVPPTVAKDLFGIDFLDDAGLKSEVIETYTKKLTGETKTAVANELAKGVKGANWFLVAKEIGDVQIDQIKKDIEKVDDLEDKALKERMKKYVEYSQKSLGEMGKIRLKQVQTILDIEDTFKPKAGDSKETIAAKEVEKARAIARATEEANEALAKMRWEEFRKSETFTALFDDLDMASDKVLDDVITRLEGFKSQWKDLPVDQMKEVDELLRKAKREKDEENNPWAEAKRLRGLIDKGKYKTVDEAMLASANASEQVSALEEELQTLELITQQRNLLRSDDEIKRGLGMEETESLMKQADVEARIVAIKGDGTEENKGLLKTQQEIVDTAQDEIQNRQDLIVSYKDQAEALGEIEKMAQDLYDSFKELNESLVDLWGGFSSDASDVVGIFSDMGMQMASTVLQTLALQAQLNEATFAAGTLGAAMNAAAGPIGWIIMGVQLLTQAITAIANKEDKMIENEVERQTVAVNEAIEAYERLEESIAEAYSTEQMRAASKQMEIELQKAIDAQKAIIAARRSAKNANVVGHEDWEALKEAEDGLKELEKRHEENIKSMTSTLTDGILDSVHDAAKEFTDAWYEAFKETGDGLSGLEENFEEMFLNLAKSQAAQQITGEYVKNWQNMLKDYIDVENQDTEITPEQAAEWAERVKATFPELSAALEGFLGVISEGLGERGGLSDLQKGIQGVTEQTAQVLEALLNSMRDTQANAYHELQKQTRILGEIRDTLDAVSGNGPRAFSVRM